MPACGLFLDAKTPSGEYHVVFIYLKQTLDHGGHEPASSPIWTDCFADMIARKGGDAGGNPDLFLSHPDIMRFGDGITLQLAHYLYVPS